jgi:hypothetical protein
MDMIVLITRCSHIGLLDNLCDSSPGTGRKGFCHSAQIYAGAVTPGAEIIDYYSDYPDCVL